MTSLRASSCPTEEQFNRMRSGQTVAGCHRCRSRRVVDGWSPGSSDELPSRSQPVYPAQILSSINAALICLFLWAYYPLRRRDGEVFALLITIYPVIRILDEMIRTDESSVLSTNFRWTISQIDQQPVAGLGRGAVVVHPVATQGQRPARRQMTTVAGIERLADAGYDQRRVGSKVPGTGSGQRTCVSRKLTRSSSVGMIGPHPGHSRPNSGTGGTFGAGNTSELLERL